MLPAPNLDDRTFQGLVDEAKRLVQNRCPEWTDHNVSDPGVTLIEAFAQMVDQLIYRLNRVPDLNYVKFLELIGVELRLAGRRPGQGHVLAVGAAAAARAGPQRDPGGHAPHRHPRPDRVLDDSRDLEIVPCAFARAGTRAGRRRSRPTTPQALSGEPGVRGVLAHAGARRRPADRADATLCRPARSPCGWSARWPVSASTRGGRRGSGRPGRAAAGPRARSTTTTPAVSTWTATSCCTSPTTTRPRSSPGERAGWLRCRLVEALPDQPTYTAPPRIQARSRRSRSAARHRWLHAEVHHLETLGRLRRHARTAVPPRAAPRRWPRTCSRHARSAGSTRATEIWTEVPHFAESGPDDLHYRIDALRRRGAARPGRAPGRRQPPALRRRARGGVRRWCSRRTAAVAGGAGNVTAGQVRVLKTSVPYVARVENRAAAVGGADAETLDDAKVRGPMLLRSRGRAVTAEDFIQLAQDIAPEVARVHCARQPRGRPGRGRARARRTPRRRRRRGPDPPGRPPPGGGHDAADQPRALDARRLVGTRLLVAPPTYVGLTVVVDVHARERYDAGPGARRRAPRGLRPASTPSPAAPTAPAGRSVVRCSRTRCMRRWPGSPVSTWPRRSR